jgi:hypothetical protein
MMPVVALTQGYEIPNKKHKYPNREEDKISMLQLFVIFHSYGDNYMDSSDELKEKE